MVIDEPHAVIGTCNGVCSLCENFIDSNVKSDVFNLSCIGLYGCFVTSAGTGPWVSHASVEPVFGSPL